MATCSVEHRCCSQTGVAQLVKLASPCFLVTEVWILPGFDLCVTVKYVQETSTHVDLWIWARVVVLLSVGCIPDFCISNCAIIRSCISALFWVSKFVFSVQFTFPCAHENIMCLGKLCHTKKCVLQKNVCVRARAWVSCHTKKCVLQKKNVCVCVTGTRHINIPDEIDSGMAKKKKKSPVFFIL